MKKTILSPSCRDAEDCPGAGGAGRRVRSCSESASALKEGGYESTGFPFRIWACVSLGAIVEAK